MFDKFTERYDGVGWRIGNTKVGSRSIYKISTTRDVNSQEKPEDGEQIEQFPFQLSCPLQGFLRNEL